MVCRRLPSHEKAKSQASLPEAGAMQGCIAADTNRGCAGHTGSMQWQGQAGLSMQLQSLLKTVALLLFLLLQHLALLLEGCSVAAAWTDWRREVRYVLEGDTAV